MTLAAMSGKLAAHSWMACTSRCRYSAASLQLLVLRLHYLLLQHHHHLRIIDTQSTLQHPYRPPGPDDAGSLSLSPSSVLIQANAQWKSKLMVPLASFVIPVFGAELCAQASTAQ